MIRAVIFDCFGVLITDALQAIRDKAGARDATAVREISDVIAANNRGLIDPSESNERIATILGMTSKELRALVAAGEAKNEELMAYVQALRSTYKTAMLSNIAGSSLRRRFDEAELDTHFDVVVASSDIGFAKPEPEAYQTVADRLGVRCDECVFIDDRTLFCDGATAVGMQAILYTNFAQFRSELDKLLTTKK